MRMPLFFIWITNNVTFGNTTINAPGFSLIVVWMNRGNSAQRVAALKNVCWWMSIGFSYCTVSVDIYDDDSIYLNQVEVGSQRVSDRYLAIGREKN